MQPFADGQKSYAFVVNTSDTKLAILRFSWVHDLCFHGFMIYIHNICFTTLVSSNFIKNLYDTNLIGGSQIGVYLAVPKYCLGCLWSHEPHVFISTYYYSCKGQNSYIDTSIPWKIKLLWNGAIDEYILPNVKPFTLWSRTQSNTSHVSLWHVPFAIAPLIW